MQDSYYIKWVDSTGKVTLEEVVVIVDDGQGAADSKTVTRTVNRGLGQFEPYLTSSKEGAPTWVGNIYGNISGSSADQYSLYFNVSFEDCFNRSWNKDTDGNYKYSAKDYNTLNLEFTPFTGESFANKNISAKFGCSNGTEQDIECTPVGVGDKLKITLNTNTVSAPTDQQYLGLYLRLTVDGTVSVFYFSRVPNPNYTGETNRDVKYLEFTDMTSLKAALNKVTTEGKYYNIHYSGTESQFTINNSIAIPANCEITFGNYDGSNPVSVTVANGTTVTLYSTEGSSADIYINNPGTFTVANGGKLTAATSGYTGNGVWGTVINCSKITVQSGGTVEVQNNGMLELFYNNQSGTAASCTLEAGSKMTVNGRMLIDGFKSVSLEGHGTVNGNGYLYLHNDSNLISGTINVNSTNWRGAEFYGTTTIASNGTVSAAGTTDYGYAVEFNGPLDNKGSITVASGTRAVISNVGYSVQNSGTIKMNGTLYLNGTKLANAGRITGSGTITGALGEDTTSYDEQNGLAYYDSGKEWSNMTPDNYSRYKFTGDPAKTVEVVIYKSSLVNDQSGSSTITPNFENFPAE